jgi:hypothetical protein
MKAERGRKQQSREVRDPKMGRRNKPIPERITVWGLIRNRALALLKECKSPDTWSEAEAKLLLRYAMFPSAIHEAPVALLFAMHPDVACSAALRLREALNKYWSRPAFALALHVAIACEYNGKSQAIREVLEGTKAAKHLTSLLPAASGWITSGPLYKETRVKKLVSEKDVERVLSYLRKGF